MTDSESPVRLTRRRLYIAAEPLAPHPESQPALAGADVEGLARTAPQLHHPVDGAVVTPSPSPPTQSLPRRYPSARIRQLKAEQTVRDHVLLAASAAAIPLPLVDMAAEAAIQVRMVKRLAEIYDIDFSDERAKALVVAALGGFSMGWAASGVLRYASFASYFATLWPSAAFNSAVTYAIGRVFCRYFNGGGRPEDLTPELAAAQLREHASRWRRPRRIASPQSSP